MCTYLHRISWLLQLTQTPTRDKFSQLTWVWVPSVGYREKSPQGDPSTCLRKKLITLPMYPFLFLECRGSLGSLPTLDELVSGWRLVRCSQALTLWDPCKKCPYHLFLNCWRKNVKRGGGGGEKHNMCVRLVLHCRGLIVCKRKSLSEAGS